MADVEVRDVLLRIGGRTLHRTGYLCAMGAGRGYVEVKETFTRADATTCRTFLDRDVGAGQILRLAEANKVRIEYPAAFSGLVDAAGYPYCGPSLEPSRTNGFTKSQKLDDAIWTKTRASITADASTAPDGTVTMDKLVEDATAGATHVLTRNTPALTDNTVSSWSIHAKAGERTWIRLGITDKSGTNRNAFFNLATGVLGTLDAGVNSAAIVKVGSSYRCTIRVSAGAGGSTPVAYVGLSTGDTVLSYNGDGVSGVYLWGAQFEADKAFESSYLATDAATVTGAADALIVPINIGPTDMTVLARFAKSVYTLSGIAPGGSPGLVAIGDPAFTAPALNVLIQNGATPQCRAEIIRTSGVSSSSGLVNMAAGNDGAVVAQFEAFAAGPICRADAGTGFGTDSAAPAAMSAFSAQKVLIGDRLSPGFSPAAFPLTGVILDVIFARGKRTRAEMLAIP